MTFEMAERWLDAGLALEIERTGDHLIVRTHTGTVFTVYLTTSMSAAMTAVSYQATGQSQARIRP